MHVESFFHHDTATFSYLVTDTETGQCAIIDPVLDYEQNSKKISHQSIQQLIQYIQKEKLQISWILETHVHADHITAAAYLKEHVGGHVVIGEHIRDVLAYWVLELGIDHNTPLNGSQFDHLVQDGEKLPLGHLTINILHTPGHTPSCVCYHIEDAVFVGDTLFMPDVGTARTDFPGGSAQHLFHSIQRLFQLPEHTRVFVGHDYSPPGTREKSCMTSIRDQKTCNVLLNADTSEKTYIAARNARDHGKTAPRLLFPSLQINLRAGCLGDSGFSETCDVKHPHVDTTP